MKKSKFSEEKLEVIYEQIKKKSISYEYGTKDYPFEVIINKFGDEKDPKASLYIPNYQREFVWDNKKKSRFIESILLGVPLTPFFVSEDENNRLEIIDGSQRIRTLIAFFNNEFRLSKPKILTEIDTATFKDLPRWHQRKMELRDFRVIVVSDKADINSRKDIFNRINTSNEKLKDSEIRKGSHSGKFYDLILELKSHEAFKIICPLTEKKEKRGEYEELILRFFAYTDSYLDFKHDVAIFLDNYLEKMNDLEFDKNEYISRFEDMTTFIKQYFPSGFRKTKNSGSTPRVRFEAIAVGTYLALQEQKDLINPNISWLSSKGFHIQTTSDSSNNPHRLKNRIEFVRDGLLNRLTEDKLDNGYNKN